jgi:hypothetical protein
MLRTSIPFTTWMEQPDRVIETAVAMLNEQDDEDATHNPHGGPQMSG